MSEPAFWRTPGQPDVLFGRGTQSSYAVEPRGEYFIGLIEGGGFHATRGRDRVAFRPGDIGVWDPSDRHAGVSHAGVWTCRLLVLEPGAPQRLFAMLPEFPNPVVRSRALAAAFARLHRSSTQAGSTLGRDAVLLEMLTALAARSPSARRPAAGIDDVRAVRLARDFLHDNVARNVSLAELARAAGSPEHTLVRAFSSRMRVPPHSYQIGLRLAYARRMLERGVGVGDAATRAGFHDQSHLHRHFVRNFGVTPGTYARATATRKDVQDSR